LSGSDSDSKSDGKDDSKSDGSGSGDSNRTSLRISTPKTRRWMKICSLISSSIKSLRSTSLNLKNLRACPMMRAF
jgi:hypothetical protein